jgi:uncharacterized protein
LPVLSDTFVPLRWCTSGHAQTVLGSQWPVKHLLLQRVRHETPDGDFFDVDSTHGASPNPHVVLLHGLEGSSKSQYIQSMLHEIKVRRWNGHAVHFRGCSGQYNRVQRTYHSADFEDAAQFISTLSGTVFLVGFSLGASVVLNLLAKSKVKPAAACAVAAPFSLEKSCGYLDSGGIMSTVYVNKFLRSLKNKALHKAKLFPHLLDKKMIPSLIKIRDFDHHITAKLCGFESGAQYYEQCSSGPLLKNIATRTLIISAQDDAIAPAHCFPLDAEKNACLDILKTKHGGHVGYIGGTMAPNFWLPNTILNWFSIML